jgi:hypothetical protein
VIRSLVLGYKIRSNNTKFNNNNNIPSLIIRIFGIRKMAHVFNKYYSFVVVAMET